MLWLLLAALLWVGVHVGIAGTALRGAVVARIGENGFRIGFSLLSFLAIVLLVAAWRGAETKPLWFAPAWLRWVLAFVMLPAFVLFVASLRKNPTAVGGDALLGAEPHGIQRVTRHPMLWSFALWALVHVIGNGDSASLVFFGAFLVTALAGMPSIDAKLAKRAPQAWARLARATSILPFGAILAGRNRLVPGEIGWLPSVVGAVAWAALLHLHPALFGVPVIIPG
ncbi:NnrU family protein [Paracraurococcus lichenis]|uniref:NnrU family protein n=1 Tax=Paracraurococcus lichenis TaxID=3064888 RepID=A0ABT9E756_9PROT|nr:NnrU family protein [Paracraurococcus sp. LOR1-02]MDO9711927.1 NnrU family protein [Paracraurococcus sp. LOR1-02]